MKKIKAFFDKLNKDLITGVVYLAAAMILFFLPGTMLHTVIKVTGALVILTAVLRFLLAIGGKVLLPTTVINSVLLLALGIVMLAMPGGMLRLIFSAIGVYLLVSTVGQVLQLLAVPSEARRLFWWIDVILAVLAFALGIWLLLSPAEAERVTEIIAGVSLAVKAIELICRAFSGGRKNAPDPDGIEAEFVDKSHEL